MLLLPGIIDLVDWVISRAPVQNECSDLNIVEVWDRKISARIKIETFHGFVLKI
jgi:hypothetical protein